MRIRLVIPIDRPAGTEVYRLAWHGFNHRYLNGKGDSSGAKLYQQQGIWSCHPSRVDQAKFWFNDGGVVSTNALMHLGQQTQPKQPIQYSRNEKNSNKSYPPSDAIKIAEHCKQIREFRDKKSAGQSEPLWRDCLGITGHCTDGEAISQEWSSGHSGYEATKTAKKLADRMEFLPTTCVQFKKTNLVGCEGCTQSCNSPITLGYEKDERFEKLECETEIIGTDNTPSSSAATSSTTLEKEVEPKAVLGTDEPCEPETKKLPETPGSSVPAKHVEKIDDKPNTAHQNALDKAQPLDPETFPHKPGKGSNQVPSTIPNVQHLLESYGIKVRYNTISKKLMIAIPGFSGMPDNADNSTFAYIMSIATLNNMPRDS